MPRFPFLAWLVHLSALAGSRVGELWTRVISPVEHFFARLGHHLLHSFDRLASIETLLVGLLKLLCWPLLTIGRTISRCLPVGSVGHTLLFWPAILVRRLGAGIFWLAEQFNLDRLLLAIAWLLQPIWRPIATLLGFLNAWLATRHWREVAMAVPALVLVAPFAYVGLADGIQGQDRIASRYRRAVDQALEAGNYAHAQLFEQKLAQLGVDTRRTDYRTACRLADDGQLALAYERMKKLAPPQAPGYAAAHAWIAQCLLGRELPPAVEPALTEETTRVQLIAQHLEQLEKLGITGRPLDQLQAQLYAQTGRIAEAAEALKPYTTESRELAITRLLWLVQAQQRTEARTVAHQLLPMFQETSRLTTQEHQARTIAAQLIGNEQQLEAALRAWQAADATNPQPTEMLAQLRRQQVEQLLAIETATPTRVVERLCDAVQLGSSPHWINRQVGLVVLRRAGSHAAQLIWEGLLNSPEVPTELLESAGVSAATRGEVLAARQVFQRLVEQGIDRATVWNNYAWALSQAPQANPQAALQAVNRALELNPTDYRLRETRGQILMKLERWSEAIADLEYALNGLPGAVEVHRSLAAAYDAMGQLEMAQFHRDQALE